jgi:hypothetical protein
MRPLILCFLVLLTFASVAHARQWTSASGKHKFEAELLAVGKDSVRLKLKQGGAIYNLPLKALSKKDNQYLRQIGRRHGATRNPSDVFYSYQRAVARASSLSQVKHFFSSKKFQQQEERLVEGKED